MVIDSKKYPALYMALRFDSDGQPCACAESFEAEAELFRRYHDVDTGLEIERHARAELRQLKREWQAEALRELVTKLWQAAEKERLDIGQVGLVPPLLHPPSLRHVAAFLGHMANEIEESNDDQ